VNYRTYDSGTPVETFQPDQVKALAPRIEKLVARLAAPRGEPGELGGTAEGFSDELRPRDPAPGV